MNKDHIFLRQGEIRDAEADALINEINNDLIFSPENRCSLGADVDAEIIRQCLAIGKLNLGEAVVTDATGLNARWIIHAASMDYDGRCTEDSITGSLRSALQKAAEVGARTVAVPPIGLGQPDIPIKRVAELLLSECLRHTDRESSVEEAVFYVADRTTLRVFEECLKQV